MANPRPAFDDDPYGSRERYDVVCRVFSPDGRELSRLNYTRVGPSAVGTLAAHLCYINRGYTIDIHITNRPPGSLEPRTDPLQAL